jgi:hypothetical protein
MAHKLPLTVWVVWYRDHIHTNVEQQLAIFPKRKDASAWIKKNAIFPADCKVKRLVVSSPDTALPK